MPSYVVFVETTIVKQSVARVEAARDVADAIEKALILVKANKGEWGQSEVEQRAVDVTEAPKAP